MLSAECLGTRHTSCFNGCDCIHHKLKTMPCAIVDDNSIFLQTVEKIEKDKLLREQEEQALKKEPEITIQTNPEIYLDSEEYQEYLVYQQDLEYDSGYYQGMYLDKEMIIETEEDLSKNRPATKFELDEQSRLKKRVEQSQATVSQALDRIKKKQDSKPKQLSLDEMFGVTG